MAKGKQSLLVLYMIENNAAESIQNPNPWSGEHISGLHRVLPDLVSVDGRPIEVWEFAPPPDDVALSKWARHFRNHYCRDGEIDLLRDGTPHSRANYLRTIKFPDGRDGFGPALRSGDFAEILVADFLQYQLGYEVPRTRYGDRHIRNESTKGSDVIGVKCPDPLLPLPGDELTVYEAKAKLTDGAAEKLQEAVKDSAKDEFRIAESLNAAKQRLLANGDLSQGRMIARFQDPVARPYQLIPGAAAVFSLGSFDPTTIQLTDCSTHPFKNLRLLVIKGEELMTLVHKLYEVAAVEA